ncbi:tRNA-splicing endonuclease subunit Sen15 [Xylaria bambusicola]|uniref:tRNA-splicing endonuclease subunit Sen15 n=1 Tax=Xylaria bambusicola TaxID=326684 RepID=UPI002008D8D0|nr:tRNA-splicing endonuclease subunit Sen15 [Xylaria bambusicola]KAI0526605.1 tRNA-splicing endonuclease subunit Sen15 [Xylaria bambusicola]
MAERDHERHLADTVLDNLKYQHDWTGLQILTHSPTDSKSFIRPMVSGLPPRRLYVHPDDQIAMLKSSAIPDGRILDTPEVEWVLPTHISEKWTLKKFAAVFDSLPAQFSAHPDRPKRIVLATIHGDSTIVYYLLHDGLVKPRQN